MPQDHPTDNPILNAARRELTERAQTTAPLRTADDAYSGSARIVSINTSAHKGTRKTPVADGHDTVIKQFGLASDAHAGHWHRQVSFLAAESINTARTRGLDVCEGDFGENFTTQGINLLSLPLGTQLKLGSEVLVEISQIGKVCTPAVPSTISPATASSPTRAFLASCCRAEKSISVTTYRWSSSAMAPVPSLPPRRSKRWSRLVAKEPCSCKTPCEGNFYSRKP